MIAQNSFDLYQAARNYVGYPLKLEKQYDDRDLYMAFVAGAQKMRSQIRLDICGEVLPFLSSMVANCGGTDKDINKVLFRSETHGV